jgi:hypothetical protein
MEIVSKIMGLRNECVNNYDALPRSPGVGAGMVNPFKEGECEKNLFLDIGISRLK